MVEPVVEVAAPLPNTEFAFAWPVEFCTREIALALACSGPCELTRAAVRTDMPTGWPPWRADIAAAETVAPWPPPAPGPAAHAGVIAADTRATAMIGKIFLRMMSTSG